MQNDKLNLAVEAINNNQVVGIPTETVYGIGVNPYSQEAVDKIFDLKGRGEDKPCLLYTSPSPRDGSISRMPSSA